MNEKKVDKEFNPVKEVIAGKAAEKVIWSTSVINKALQAIREGKPLKATPFKDRNTKLLKPELVRKYTAEEIEDYKKCASDPVYFASKCYLMTPEGLQPCLLRDYQKEYIRHLQHNRFSILLAARQSGKTLNLTTNIIIKIDKTYLNFYDYILEKYYFYIKDNFIYIELPLFELYNLYCKQTMLWKIKYKLYKIIYNLEYGWNKRNEISKET